MGMGPRLSGRWRRGDSARPDDALPAPASEGGKREVGGLRDDDPVAAREAAAQGPAEADGEAPTAVAAVLAPQTAIDVADRSPSLGRPEVGGPATGGLETGGLETGGLETGGLETGGLEARGVDSDAAEADALEADALEEGGRRLDSDGLGSGDMDADDLGSGLDAGDLGSGLDAGDLDSGPEAETRPVTRRQRVRWRMRVLVPRRRGRGARRRRRSEQIGAWAFASVTVAPALILMAWLVIGLALLLAGRFTPIPMVLIAVPVGVGLVVLASGWPASGRWPGPGLGRWAGGRPLPGWAAWCGLAGTLVVAAGFAAWQLRYASPAFVVDRDPGAATQYGYWIAEYGSLPIPRSLAAFGGPHAGLGFSSFGFAAGGGGVAPQISPGVPILLSAGLWAHGLSAIALASPIVGALAVLSVGGLAGRLAGPLWAPVGALLLALSLPEVYTSRSAFSETLAQALLFTGLCLVVDCLGGDQSRVQAALGGISLGLVTVAGPSLVVTVLPAVPFVGVMVAGGRRQALPLGAGLLGGAACGIGADVALSGAAGAAAGLRTVGMAAVAFAGATALALVLTLIPAIRRAAPRWFAARPLRWLPDAAAVAVAVGAIALAVRPYLQTARGPANGYIASLQRAAYLLPQPGRTYAEDSLYWVIWYLGAPALVLGIAGLAVAARRSLRGLLAWRDESGSARAWALPAAVVAWSAAVVLWQPGTVPDQPWASRRLVPVVLPGLVVCGVWMASWLIRRARRRGAGITAVSAAIACFVVALAAPAAVTTFGVGARWAGAPGLGPTRGGLALARTGTGEAAAVRRLCGLIPSNAAALFVDQVAARRFAPVVRGMCGVPSAVMAGASPAQVQAVIAAVERAGRRPAVFATSAAELSRYGASPSRVMDLDTKQDAHVLTQPPASVWPVRYVLWMSAPQSVPAAVGA